MAESPPGQTAHVARATLDDVFNCYRLLLGRLPDAGGLDHYRRRLGQDELSVAQLVAEFLGSVEFARAHPSYSLPARAVEVAATVEGFSMNVDANDYAVGHTVARTGIYEPEVTAVMRSLLAPGATFVDVGANIGWFTLLGASLVGPEGRVVAIEPNPLNVSLLTGSAKSNGFSNIEAVTVALAEAPGAVALETDGSNGRVIPVDGPPAQPVPASFVVPAYPLDDVLSSLGVDHVDVMKIDVEGAEPMVLRGARGTLAGSRPVLVSEFYPLALDSSPWGSAEEYLVMLRHFGYRLSVIDDPALGADVEDGAIFDAISRLGRDHVDLLAEPVAPHVRS